MRQNYICRRWLSQMQLLIQILIIDSTNGLIFSVYTPENGFRRREAALWFHSAAQSRRTSNKNKWIQINCPARALPWSAFSEIHPATFKEMNQITYCKCQKNNQKSVVIKCAAHSVEFRWLKKQIGKPSTPLLSEQDWSFQSACCL